LAAGLAAALAVGAAFWLRNTVFAPRIEHIDVVNAGLENDLGDAQLADALNEALRIDLEQSPFLNLLSRAQAGETLQEMQRDPNTALSPALALEICQRNNAQTMLHGTVAGFGREYLLTYAADSCVTGRQIAAYKTEAPSKEALLTAIDRAAASVRRQLGESGASREKYQIPIAQATTSSLDALRAYTEAGEPFRRGDMRGAQPLLERAIALDPQFASAYRILGSTWYNLGDFSQAAVLYSKAFALREHTTEREQLGIEVMYYGYALNDYEESIRRTRQFLDIYPDVANSWVSLANLYTLLGEYPQAIDAAQRAVALDPHSGVAAIELNRALMRAGRLTEAKAQAAAAMADGKDHWDLHSVLFQIAFAQHDSAGLEREGSWGLTHQHASASLQDLGRAAAAQGKLREASDDFTRARTESLRMGEGDFANGVLIRFAQTLALLERPSAAAAVVKQARGDDGNPDTPGEIACIHAQTGDSGYALAFLRASDPGNDRNTVRARIFVPMVQAMLALNQHKPQDAIRALEPARPYQLRDFSIPYLRAQAETAAGQLEAAAEDYRLVLDNQGADPVALEYPLAHLRLARIFALQNRREPARQEYEAFITAWNRADPDMPQVEAARRELAGLTR